MMVKESSPVFSIVTVTYNCAATVLRTLESVVTQDYPSWQLCIIDGSSSDGTVDVITEYIDRIPYKERVKFISEPDNGIYDAMNKGIRIADGEWIFFLNVGDVLSSTSTLSDLIASDLSFSDVVYGDVIHNYDGKLEYKKTTSPFFAPNHLYLHMGFGHQSVFVKTVWAKKYPFDLHFKCCADYNMIRTIHNQGGKFKYVAQAFATTDVVKGFSDSHALLQLYELALICGEEKSFHYYYLRFKMTIKKFLGKL